MSQNNIRETAFAFGEIVLYLKYVSRVEERRRKGRRTNIYVSYLRPNIVLYYDINDPLSEIKVRIIDKDSDLTLNILLVISILLAIDGSKYELKNKLIPAVRRNNKKVIYVNNNPPPKVFFLARSRLYIRNGLQRLNIRPYRTRTFFAKG